MIPISRAAVLAARAPIALRSSSSPSSCATRSTGTDRRVASYGGVIGAATFDGLAIGFVPGLYGQTGRALSAVAALILFALATVGWADRLMPIRDET